MKRHGCVQQKAAYLSKFVIPDEAFGRYGLPFFCLLCCTEPTQLTPGQYRPIRKNTTVPLTLCENAMRFESKLHLTVHILCCHSTRTQPGSCGECSFHSNRPCKIEQVWDANKFWTEAPEPSKRKERCDARGDTESSSTDSESDVPRPIYRLHDSILGRQGLTNLEQHLDDIHWPLFKLLSWYIKGQETVANRPRTEVYSCPLCELIQIKQVLQNPDAQSDDSIHGPSYPTRNRHSKQNNALLQSHIACYHAGSKQTDMLFGLCQVCGHTDSMRSVGVEIRTTPREPYIHGSAQHLIRAGHVGRLQREFTRCVDQGRLSAHSVQCLFDWTTVCLFCWQRFTCQLGPNNRILHAQCALQTHLIVAHCTPIILVGVSNSSSCSSTETIRKAQIQHQAHGSGMIIRQCGWCGQTPEDLLNTDEMISSEPESSEMLQALIDSDPQWAKIYADYRWYQTHEKAHAVALYEWWQDQ
ncbi:hypothetical protein D915_005956 [Fasciola hepatica]|uniref:Uncharacterized protein n=1 Tax=Fasciola hepatica TaxID=6192 RepID=A0A4E0RR44_FASHE|nr:hypothetical protein D915_005956 [Fasciola hepatica]